MARSRRASGGALEGAPGGAEPGRTEGGGDRRREDVQTPVGQAQQDGKLVAMCLSAAAGHDDAYPLFRASSLLLSERRMCDALFQTGAAGAGAGAGSGGAYGSGARAGGGGGAPEFVGGSAAGGVDVAAVSEVVAVLARQRKCLPPPVLPKEPYKEQKEPYKEPKEHYKWNHQKSP